ncbi:hypothetical protein Glove_197g57 [Diversispora epigaea]|uniref:GLTSCR protein conserved domain-containing protein n=1 Tax=Diversispora epigaea TaxID=1348612 RepID=A0A397ITM0_9GLOM|nr:hypothetical protein Glove_197g57 [Diversispora epigaea]
MAKVMSYQDEEYEASNANAPSNSRGHEPRGSIQQNQDEQITTLNLAGLSVLMYKKKGEIIYRLADNMSVNSLSNEQREKLLKEIKALHDSSSITPTIVSSSIKTPQQQLAPATQQSPIISSSSSSSSSSLSSQIRTSNNTTITSSIRSQPSIAPAVTNPSTSARPQQLIAPASSVRPQPLINPISSSSSVTAAAASSSTTSSSSYSGITTTSTSTLFPTSQLTNTPFIRSSSIDGPTKMINDLSLRSTRRYNKTGRYSKKRSQMDEEESPYNQSYTQSYYTQPIPMPMNTTGTYYPSVTNVTNINVTNSTNATTLASRLTMPSYYSGMHSINSTIPQGIKRSYSVTDKERTERTMEEYQHHADVVQRFDAAIKADQMSVIQPDYKTPFRSYQDAVARLLPYHIFDYPDEDMKNNDQTTELDSTKIALKFYKKRKVVFDKYNEIIKREAEKPCSIALTNLCERLVNEDYRASNNVLKEEGRRVIEQARILSQHQHQQQQQQQQQQQHQQQQQQQQQQQ